jgi:hypothetical protein
LTKHSAKDSLSLPFELMDANISTSLYITAVFFWFPISLSW